MWVNRQMFDLLLRDSRALQQFVGMRETLVAQKAKDDINIDWLRHRVNALEKQNAVLMQKAAGIAMPVPEIEFTRPGTPLAFDTMPSFEDVGDDEAQRLGIGHDDNGVLAYTK